MCDEMWMCLSVDEVEGPVKAAGTYFKTRLFVLVKAHCDSSSTGDLSWTQPSSKNGGSSSYTHTPPSLVAPGPPGPVFCTGCPVNTGLSGAMPFLCQLALFFCTTYPPPPFWVSVFFVLSLCPPKKPQERSTPARKKKGHTSFTVSPSLSAVPE